MASKTKRTENRRAYRDEKLLKRRQKRTRKTTKKNPNIKLS